MDKAYHEILAERIYLYPIGDVHIGDKNCDYDKLMEYIEWIAVPPDKIPRYVILTGDWCNTATRSGVSSIHDQNLTLTEQMNKAVEILTPIADKVLGAVCGNHEDRLQKEAGFDPMRNICERLGVPYFGYSGIVHVKVISARAARAHKRVPEYVIYVHHTTGGGATLGGKINRVEKLSYIVDDADIYIGAHNHFEVLGKSGIYSYDKKLKEIIKRERVFVDAGGFLKWEGSYAEAKQLPPGGTGCPRLELDGEKKMAQANIFMT